MLPRTVGLLQILFAAINALSPHSMQTERCVSNYNNIRSVSMLPETVNHHLQIALNATGTAQFDPRPAVAEFLKYKDRRYREPNTELYARREFISKFFRKDGCM